MRTIPSQPSTEVKRLNVIVPIQLHNEFKSLTAAQGENMTDVLLQFIRDYVARHGAKPKGQRK